MLNFFFLFLSLFWLPLLRWCIICWLQITPDASFFFLVIFGFWLDVGLVGLDQQILLHLHTSRARVSVSFTPSGLEHAAGKK